MRSRLRGGVRNGDRAGLHGAVGALGRRGVWRVFSVVWRMMPVGQKWDTHMDWIW